MNWGLGHATRCIPLINALIKHNFEPIIASDGAALKLLQLEFPNVKTFILPSYNITYAKKGKSLKLKLLKSAPHILKTLGQEKKYIANLLQHENIDGIISDNRFGIRHNSIPCVFLTHQINVLSGSTTWLSSKLHQNIIAKFNACWVPDYPNTPNLSGTLGHSKTALSTLKYIGPLSRFKPDNSSSKYNVLVVLSGPEPQRGYLEAVLLKKLKHYDGNILFIKGTVESKQTCTINDHITLYNFMTSRQLNTALNESDLVLSRSGYTTIMDLAKLKKKALFIPTPGQFEQTYLADKFMKEGVAYCCKQDDFELELLDKAQNYSGFKPLDCDLNYKDLFSLF